MEGKSVEQLCDYLREDVAEAILINNKKHNSGVARANV